MLTKMFGLYFMFGLILIVNSSVTHDTIIDALNYNSKILDSLLSLLSEITVTSTSSTANEVITNNYLSKIQVDINKNYHLHLSWDETFNAIDRFVKLGNHGIALDGIPGTTMSGKIKSNTAFIICPAMIPMSCRIKMRHAKFDVTRTHDYTKYLRGGTKGLGK
ncbi:hypothetical protein [Wuhan arthropod virus 1]|uniref:hypothetical protein n=1 Tax=Wuhan arthropod virus 1 TaxID=1923690 RepID=UPI00090B6B83|nr:hypothetical protein [Wuhan arthropod virus 1]APG77758.1 hypothetical protein [Wuhan arthropod virus 1]